MIDEMEWTASGERLVPEEMGGTVIEAEHLARYRMALDSVAGKVVLDAGCGVGWGSHLLLAEGGALEVIGIDNFAPAIDYACAHYPGPRFELGDMTKLDAADDSVDVITCFEALEHVHDHATVLAEFRRVLRPDGLLFVSSPNPGVYPDGNPYHVHEVGPDELRASVAAEFPHSVLLHQELLIGSLVAEPGSLPAPVEVTRIGDSTEPTNQYGIVVASGRPVASWSPTLVLVPSTQLTHLDELSRALQAQADGVAAERERLQAAADYAAGYAADLVEQVRSLNHQLVDAGVALRSVMDERDTLIGRVIGAEGRTEDVTVELGRERDAYRQTQLRQSRELDRLRLQRDRLLADALHDEQALHYGPVPQGQAVPPGLAAPGRSDEAALAASSAALAAQVNAMLQSHSWRITAPLRRLRTVQSRMRDRAR